MSENQKSFQELLAFWKNMDNNCSSTYNEPNILNTNPSSSKKEANNISELETDLEKEMVLENENLKEKDKLLKTSDFNLIPVDTKDITMEQTKTSKKNIIIEQETNISEISENIQKAKKETIDANSSALVEKKTLPVVQEKKLTEKESKLVLKNNATEEENLFSDKQKLKFQIVKYKNVPMSHKHYAEQKNKQEYINNVPISFTVECEFNIKENLEIGKETNTESTENNLLLKQVNKKTSNQMPLSKKHNANNTEYVSKPKAVIMKEEALINEHLIEQKKHLEAFKIHSETIADNTEKTIKTEIIPKNNENQKIEKSDLEEEHQKHQDEQKKEKVITHKGILKPQTITDRIAKNNGSIPRKSRNKRVTIICPRLMKENILSDEPQSVKNKNPDSKVESISTEQETELIIEQKSNLFPEKIKRGSKRRVTIIDSSIMKKAALSCDLSLVQEEVDVPKIKISSNIVKSKISERQSIINIDDLRKYQVILDKKSVIKQNISKKEELLFNNPNKTNVPINELGGCVEAAENTSAKRKYSVLEMAQRYSDEREKNIKKDSN
ncbi:hypothetical protein CDIK_0591 [Cucumispora dikerogammari]|nr:hypothetical protein CDIK_0591 [Cucumispora dikerogammari]